MDELQKQNIDVVGFSSDGDSRLFKVQTAFNRPWVSDVRCAGGVSTLL